MKKKNITLCAAFLFLSLAATGCKPRQTPRVDAPKAVATEEKQQPATADTTAAPSPKGPQIKDITSRVKWGYRPANRTKNDVDIVVVHSNYHVVDQARQKFDFNVDGCIKQFRDGGTSAHYLITRDGTILKMVDEKNVAYHAGKSALPDGSRQWLNSSSIGIEVISMKRNGPTEAQYRALDELIKDICSRYNIRYLVRHSDIAIPLGRKDDPWGMDWKRVCKSVKAEYPNITTYNIPVKNNPQFK